MVKKSDETLPVSSSNPCPFLRALVAGGELADATEPLEHVASVIVETASRGEGHPKLPAKAIYAIALVANGLSPLALINTKRHGVRLNGLRGGPLDKQGAGSGILDVHAEVNKKELARLAEFAQEKVSAGGSTELGLALPELRSYMDANFARAAGRRRIVDRALMNGEWPVLLKVMGKQSPGGRYLSLREVQELFTKRRLPERMEG